MKQLPVAWERREILSIQVRATTTGPGGEVVRLVSLDDLVAVLRRYGVEVEELPQPTPSTTPSRT